jgi:hypothetical protein
MSCVAVGLAENPESYLYRNLAESWNGSRWSMAATVPSPAPARHSLFNGVSCTVDACTAVGVRFGGGDGYHTLAERYSD